MYYLIKKKPGWERDFPWNIWPQTTLETHIVVFSVLRVVLPFSKEEDAVAESEAHTGYRGANAVSRHRTQQHTSYMHF